MLVLLLSLSLSLSLFNVIPKILCPFLSVLVQREALPKGQQFMIQLLVSSLMADQGLENSLRTAIAMETKDEEEILQGQQIQEQVVPLLHLVQQLISNTTSVLLPYLKQVQCKRVCVCVCEKEGGEKEREMPVVIFLLLFSCSRPQLTG